MAKDDPSNRRKAVRVLRYCLFITMVAAANLICLAATERDAAGQAWQAPPAEMAKKNPVATSDESIKAGEKVYAKYCIKCHGKTGDGDGPDAMDLGLDPTRFSDRELQSQSDGSFYWKITVGKKPMPGYKTRLSDTDRWNVINYLRTLAK